jgi:hypothetical protein
MLGQRLKLPVAGAVADHEKVGDDGIGTQIKQDDIFGLFVLDQINNVTSQS